MIYSSSCELVHLLWKKTVSVLISHYGWLNKNLWKRERKIQNCQFDELTTLGIYIITLLHEKFVDIKWSDIFTVLEREGQQL